MSMLAKLCCIISPPANRRQSSLRNEAAENPANGDQSGNQKMQKLKSSQNVKMSSFLEGLGVSHTKNLSSSFRAKENIEFVDMEAGEECDICNSRPKTHFVVPCGHSACLPCWSAWLFTELGGDEIATLETLKNRKPKIEAHHKCFVCQKPVKTIKRFSYTVVPKHAYEDLEADFEDLTTSKRISKKFAEPKSLVEMDHFLDSSLEKLMRLLLTVKDELKGNVVEKLREVEDHVAGFARVDADARTAILSVELVTVVEAFKSLGKIFEDKASSSVWSKFVHEIERFQFLLGCVDKYFDSYMAANSNSLTTSEGEGDDEEIAQGNLTSSVEHLESIQSTIELAGSKISLAIQWATLQELLKDVSLDSSLVPTVLNPFRNNPHEGQIDEGFISEVMSLSESCHAQVKSKFETLLEQDLPLALAKLSSVVEL